MDKLRLVDTTTPFYICFISIWKTGLQWNSGRWYPLCSKSKKVGVAHFI